MFFKSQVLIGIIALAGVYGAYRSAGFNQTTQSSTSTQTIINTPSGEKVNERNPQSIIASNEMTERLRDTNSQIINQYLPEALSYIFSPLLDGKKVVYMADNTTETLEYLVLDPSKVRAQKLEESLAARQRLADASLEKDSSDVSDTSTKEVKKDIFKRVVHIAIGVKNNNTVNEEMEAHEFDAFITGPAGETAFKKADLEEDFMLEKSKGSKASTGQDTAGVFQGR